MIGKAFICMTYLKNFCFYQYILCSDSPPDYQPQSWAMINDGTVSFIVMDWLKLGRRGKRLTIHKGSSWVFPWQIIDSENILVLGLKSLKCKHGTAAVFLYHIELQRKWYYHIDTNKSWAGDGGLMMDFWDLWSSHAEKAIFSVPGSISQHYFFALFLLFCFFKLLWFWFLSFGVDWIPKMITQRPSEISSMDLMTWELKAYTCDKRNCKIKRKMQTRRLYIICRTERTLLFITRKSTYKSINKR